MAAAVLTAIWQWPIKTNHGQVVAIQPPPAPQGLEFVELQVLFSPPPVDSLDQLGLQQAAFVSALDQVVKE